MIDDISHMFDFEENSQSKDAPNQSFEISNNASPSFLNDLDEAFRTSETKLEDMFDDPRLYPPDTQWEEAIEI